MVLIVTKEELNEKLEEAGDKLVVIDFFAPWCSPCTTIAPKIKELAQEMTDVCFFEVDVDESNDLVIEYAIDSMPTFIFIKNKKQLDKVIGANFEKFKETVLKHK